MRHTKSRFTMLENGKPVEKDHEYVPTRQGAIPSQVELFCDRLHGQRVALIYKDHVDIARFPVRVHISSVSVRVVGAYKTVLWLHLNAAMCANGEHPDRTVIELLVHNNGPDSDFDAGSLGPLYFTRDKRIDGLRLLGR